MEGQRVLAKAGLPSEGARTLAAHKRLHACVLIRVRNKLVAVSIHTVAQVACEPARRDFA